MAAPINFLSLYDKWGNDSLSQLTFIDQLRSDLSTFKSYVDNKLSFVVQLNQQLEPTQAQWEQAWLSQTGRVLPIPPNAILLWYNTATNTFGGQYGTSSGRSSVYKREPFYPRGATIYFDFSSLSSSVSPIATLLSGQRANMPSLTFTINQPFDLYLTFSVVTSTLAGTAQTWVDFELNGNKVGTAYYGLPANVGFFAPSVFSQQEIVCQIPIFNLPSGDYVIQSLIGHSPLGTGTNTFGIGGDFGLRILTARAVSR